MSPNSHQHTAKIYQFPRRPRFHRLPEAVELDPVADPRLRRALSVESGSGWYHEQAIDAARDARKP